MPRKPRRKDAGVYKPAKEILSVTISVNVTQDEYEQLCSLSRANQLSLSRFIRDLVRSDFKQRGIAVSTNSSQEK